MVSLDFSPESRMGNDESDTRVILIPSGEDGRRISTDTSSTACKLRSFGEPRRFASG